MLSIVCVCVCVCVWEGRVVDTHWETRLSLGLWCVRVFSDVGWIANVCYFVVSVSFRYMYMHVHARRERTHVRMFGHPWLLLLCFGIVLLVDAVLSMQQTCYPPPTVQCSMQQTCCPPPTGSS